MNSAEIEKRFFTHTIFWAFLPREQYASVLDMWQISFYTENKSTISFDRPSEPYKGSGYFIQL